MYFHLRKSTCHDILTSSVIRGDLTAIRHHQAGQGRERLPAIAGGDPVRPPSRPIIFGLPAIGATEIRAVTECLRSGWIGQGERVEEFEKKFAEYKGASSAAALSSCTAALHLSLVALGIGPGDEVIVPAMTFCATTNVVIHTGATLVLADCNPLTFNLEAEEIERRITPRTKAIIVVHMCGRAVDMPSVMQVARRHKLRVIEDCAHAVETICGDRAAGLWGDVGCFSFYPTKNLTTGDGGMAISNNSKIVARIKRLSLHGADKDAWIRRTVGGSYKIVEAGFKCNMTNIAAAFGLSQLAALEKRWRSRQMMWDQYNQRLSGLPLDLPQDPAPHTRHAYHLYTPLLQLNRLSAGRDQILQALAAENVGAGIHYKAVHVQPYYRKRFGYKPGDFPAAHRVGNRTLSLPLSAALDSSDVSDACCAIARVLCYYSKK